jgi:hypothetical protein
MREKKYLHIPFIQPCDSKGFVLGAIVTGANIHDSQI